MVIGEVGPLKVTLLVVASLRELTPKYSVPLVCTLAAVGGGS